MASPVQAPRAVVLVRSSAFHPNPETAGDNRFQSAGGWDPDRVGAQAHREVTAVADALRGAGVEVHLFDDDDPSRPDCVFPNNWISTHEDGRVVLYPMYAPSRRGERRADVLEVLRRQHVVTEVVDYSGHEAQGSFLEGTGSLVLDHLRRVAYAARSRRTHAALVERFCADFDYEPVVFDATDEGGAPIYHTNVMLSVGTDFALVGAGTIPDADERRAVLERLEASERAVIELDTAQVSAFAGNALELQGRRGRVLALSQRAHDSLRPDQRAAIEASARLLPVAIPTIELSGGSVRCLLAGVHLPDRDPAQAEPHIRPIP